jgi:nucleotide-binding universal stress UspA family protein
VTTIVFGYDGSTCADRAVDLLARLPWDPGSSVATVTAVPDVRAIRSAWGPLVLGDARQVEAELMAAAREQLEPAIDRLRAARLSAEPVVATGRAANLLALEARQRAADLIVVGSRGLGPIRSGIVGSVSMEVMDLMPCPVLVARSAAISSVLIATDGSADAVAAETALVSLPVAHVARVHVVSGVDVLRPWTIGVAPSMLAFAHAEQARYEQEATHEHESAVAEAVARLRAAGIAATGAVRRGQPASVVLEAAAAAQADLIVLGTRGRTGLTRLVLGSVARAITHHADASVLVWHDARSSSAARPD